MLFNSVDFLIFLSLAVVAYYAIPYRFRTPYLLAISYYFYMCWKAEYIVLVVISTLSNYAGAIWMERASKQSLKKLVLAFCLIVNLGMLVLFKYLNFFGASVNRALDALNIMAGVPAFDILLPVGISFFTFKSVSYAIDAYNGRIKPERNLVRFAVYVAFFPALLAGPIDRAKNLLPQFSQKFDFDYNRVTNGLLLILWGFFKKIVIADRLALLFNPMYANPENYNPGTLLLSCYAFTFQIYCDFSGYSDIAIGSALLMGHQLMENFHRPYFATSVRDFWRRWHISLTSWFRDYLYIPLGGNRVSKFRWYVNIMIVFLVSGLWHGANWTFIAWGGLHGLFFVLSRRSAAFREKMAGRFRLSALPGVHRLVRVLLTFHLVVFAWIFFWAKSISDAFLVVGKLWTGFKGLLTFSVDFQTIARLGWISPELKLREIAVAVATIAVMEVIHFLQRDTSFPAYISARPAWMRWALYFAMVWVILIFGKYGTNSQEFIYFQF